MKQNIDKMKNEFFKKSVSVGHHNVKYTWMQIILVILNCVKCLETIEEGARSPSPQTIRDRLLLDGSWLEYYHKAMWKMAMLLLRRFGRYTWFISIDETYVPFFGNRKKLNKELVKTGLGKLVFGYRAKHQAQQEAFAFLWLASAAARYGYLLQ